MAQWRKDPNSLSFQHLLVALGFYATKLEANNDPAERALETLKDIITRFHNKENLQHSLATVVEERKPAKAIKSGKISKANLMNIIRPANNTYQLILFLLMYNLCPFLQLMQYLCPLMQIM